VASALLAVGSVVAGCSSGTSAPNGLGPVTFPMKDHALDVGGIRVPLVRHLPSYCGCELVVTAQDGYRVYRYVGPGSPGPTLVAVGANAPAQG